MADAHRSPHILVLDSSQGFLDLMRALLQEEGYRVSTDDKEHQTIDDVAAMQPDLIILDFLWVNDHAGWQMLQLFALDQRTSHIPTILCTAGVQEVEALRPHLSSMHVEVVIKPFNLTDILAAIEKQLGHTS